MRLRRLDDFALQRDARLGELVKPKAPAAR
jgi:hypothetical protein